MIEDVNKVGRTMDELGDVAETLDAAAVVEPDSTGNPAREIQAMLGMLFGRQRRRFLIAAGELDLHPAQAGTLLHLASPLPMTEIAARLGCDNSNVTGLIDRLQARGLVERRPSLEDRRVRLVELTEAGERLRGEMLARLGRSPLELERLSVGEQAQLRDLLRRALPE
jgi:DNA-binding MarR family transcriptional regulator